MSGDKPLVIVTTLDPSIKCPAQETGTWSINGYGGKCRLEYVTESLYGRPTTHSNAYQWEIGNCGCLRIQKPSRKAQKGNHPSDG
jgi:hypothetical protein